MRYAEEIFETRRRKTREVMVGAVGVGGNNPIRVQSMTTSNTRDVDATVTQILRLEDVGCEIVRMTVQGMKEVEACEAIKSALLQRGCLMPLVADIHFYPPAAMRVVEFVDKVRINPGNFADKRALFIKKEYDDATYSDEIEKIEEVFAPLVLKCKLLKKSLRIGTNHGSLSDRIMNRYGDTPRGMVESAFEFARICRKYDFHDVIFSMKASNPLVMIEAYRLLSAEMFLLGWDYPLHLGVTEAGEGEDGRIKSALGIGALLLDGIGDTIRVSLTEDPWAEIDPCKRLAHLASSQQGMGTIPFKETFRKLSGNTKPASLPILGNQPSLYAGGAAILPVKQEELLHPDFFSKLELKKGVKGLFTPDFLWVEELAVEDGLEAILRDLSKSNVGILSESFTHPLVTRLKKITTVSLEDDVSSCAVWIDALDEESLQKACTLKPKFFLFSSKGSLVHEGRRLFERLAFEEVKIPVVLLFDKKMELEDSIIHFSAECGALLIDGQFDGLCLAIDESFEMRKSLVFALLQASRRKTVKTEFISCPGCGRTLFDLQSVSRGIREKTAHLPGVRIAIMGCIVNGPGEMADADFGYVGSRPGKIDLYVGKDCVEKNIDFAEADSRLIELIKRHGKWVEPSVL